MKAIEELKKIKREHIRYIIEFNKTNFMHISVNKDDLIRSYKTYLSIMKTIKPTKEVLNLRKYVKQYIFSEIAYYLNEDIDDLVHTSKEGGIRV